jgi:hypothetical protein
MKNLFDGVHGVVYFAACPQFKKRRHLRLPTDVNQVVLHISAAFLKIHRFKVANEQAIGAEEKRVVAPTRIAKSIEHFRPDFRMTCFVLIHPVWANFERETETHCTSCVNFLRLAYSGRKTSLVARGFGAAIRSGDSFWLTIWNIFRILEDGVGKNRLASVRCLGYASIYFSDSDADGRQDSSEVCRVSGKVDAVRLPKEIYYAHRVMQNEKPDLHILGHRSYPLEQPATPEEPALPCRPAAPGRPPVSDLPAIPAQPAHKTAKTVYVVANTESVELFLNGNSLGANSKPENGFAFAFPDVAFAPGTLKAVGKNANRAVAEQILTTAGPPVAIKLTATTGPQGFKADGQDVAFIDVEVLDAKGQRCPTDNGRVDFTISGPGIWRGGYNSGMIDSTNNLYLNTECGINRVFVRSILSPGIIKVTARRSGLQPAQVQIVALPVVLTDGLVEDPSEREAPHGRHYA